MRRVVVAIDPRADSARTALHRKALSRPARIALQNVIYRSIDTVLDYGCGYGDDVRLLREKAVEVVGFDPTYAPVVPKPADVVLCSYVLNTLSDSFEREAVLAKAFALTKRALIVAVRTDRATFKGKEAYRDGWLTKAGTFQRPYRAQEFREFVKATLGREVQQLAPGVVVVYKKGMFT
jgi:DNA phosphorothioation-associated putative methyltransferase